MQNNGIKILFAGICVIFIYALMQLFILRYEIGDVYPPFSSFRSDPLGVRALYGALESLPGISAHRNLEPVFELTGEPDTTLIFCGADLSRDRKEVIEKLESFAAVGGRILIAFYPVSREPTTWLDSLGEEEEKQEEGEKAEGETAGEESACEREDNKKQCTRDSDRCEESCGASCCGKLVSIEDRWGFSFAYWLLPTPEEDGVPGAQAEKQSGAEELPGYLSWHSAICFENLDEAWRPVYARDDHVVIMERNWEEGTIVLLSDSYLLSNEAMREERHPRLLAWLVGPSSTVIFDEVHLGVFESPGIMTLIRQYRLDRVLLVMVFLAALFVWKNAFSLIPKREADFSGAVFPAAGRDSTAGLVNLLRRSIPSNRILSVCVKEWQRSHIFDSRGSNRRANAVQAVVERQAALPSAQRNSVEAYRKISAILTERNWKRDYSN